MAHPELLTDKELATLRRLVRQEARRLGYSTEYFDDDTWPGSRHDWPPALRRLRTLMVKLLDHKTLG